MSTLFHDLRYGLRMLGKDPGFTAISIVTLAIGIGANTAIFSGLNGLFLRPLPVKNPSQLVEFAFGQRGASGEFNFSYPDFRDIREEDTSIRSMFAYRVGSDGLSDGHRADRILTSFVTGNYFTALGLRPALGRLIGSTERSATGSNPVLVLGYSYWKSRFNGDPSVIGRQVSVNGHAVTMIGVAPKGFRGLLSVAEMQAYLPINMAAIGGDRNWTNERGSHDLFVLGRLKRGVSLAQAQASLNVIAARLSRQYPKTDAAARLRVFPEQEARLNPQPPPGHYDRELLAMGLFLGLALLLLLLACFNVANILLVRATAREHEMAVRAALGAGRGRLTRQVFTESLLLAFLGGGAGILAGAWASSLLGSLNFNVGVPYRFDFGVDWRVLAYSLAATVAAGIVMGMVPAVRASRAYPEHALREGSHAVALGRHRMRDALVILQVAASMVLLIVAGLFTRSLARIQYIDLGFNPHHVLNLTMDLHQGAYSEKRGEEFYKNLLARVRALPGVESASLADCAPLDTNEDDDAVYVEGQLPPPGQSPPRFYDNQVSPGYFKTMEIPILRGRAFRETDNEAAPNVAIINETMARRLWPNEDPLGRRFKVPSQSNGWIKVVGVAKDGKYRSIWGPTPPYFYLPLAQDFDFTEILQVRTFGPPEAMAGEIERQVHDMDSNLPVYSVETMDQTIDGPYGLFDFRLAAWLAAALGLLGLVLAVIGVHGVVSYAATQRTHEIGIRMALGAQTGEVMKMVFGQGLAIVAVGVAAGLVLALGVVRTMAAYLFGVSPYDPVTYAGVAIVLAGVALLACYAPARRATKIDPMVALRYE